MFVIPPEFLETISLFSPLFSKNVFLRACQLLLGTILTRGNRTVCSVLRTLGLSEIKNWSKYHRVLSRSKWSALKCSEILVKKLLQEFSGAGPLVFGMDETIERRWGKKIKARGIYRDAVRSSKGHFVKCSGLRWIGVMLLSEIPWTNRIWALPFLTVLAPSKRYHASKGKPHKKLSDWARQICYQVHRWFPDRQCIMLGDGSYAVRSLIDSTRHMVTWITPLRLDASVYDFAPKVPLGQKRPQGRPPIKGKKQEQLKKRLLAGKLKFKTVRFSSWYGEENKKMKIASGTCIWYRGGEPAVPIRWVVVIDPKGELEPFALLCTDLKMNPIEIVQHYVKRWQVEVTFQEVRAHLGVETQRQWSDLAILRTTPVLMALFSLITIWANQLHKVGLLDIEQTTWYKKQYPTFADALASVRKRIYQYQISSQSPKNGNREKIKQLLIKHLKHNIAGIIQIKIR